MNYRKLGRSDIMVSEVGLGCEHLEKKDYTLVKSIIDTAIDNGINIFDIFMSEPNVRTNIGKALKGRREKVILQGHIGSAWLDGQYNRTRKLPECKAAFEDFLTRLQTDYVDIGMIHYVDTAPDYDDVFLTDIIEYAKELKEKGIIKTIGLSSHDPVSALKAVETGTIDVLMFSINPAYDLLSEDTVVDDLFVKETYSTENLKGINAVRDTLYKTCEKMGVAITVMKSLGAGVLLDAQTSPFSVALSAKQCMHYALTRPSVASVLIGCSEVSQVIEAASYSNASNEEKDYSVILSQTPKYSLKGQCMYCNHCLPCPSNIDIAGVTKLLDLAKHVGLSPTVNEHYKNMKTHAGDCIECGACESNCPFEVKIIDNMKKAVNIFKM